MIPTLRTAVPSWISASNVMGTALRRMLPRLPSPHSLRQSRSQLGMDWQLAYFWDGVAAVLCFRACCSKGLQKMATRVCFLGMQRVFFPWQLGEKVKTSQNRRRQEQTDRGVLARRSRRTSEERCECPKEDKWYSLAHDCNESRVFFVSSDIPRAESKAAHHAWLMFSCFDAVSYQSIRSMSCRLLAHSRFATSLQADLSFPIYSSRQIAFEVSDVVLTKVWQQGLLTDFFFVLQPRWRVSWMS
mmetsp:Transcript_29320/g.45918  ORF Transcript_29320/g.45918 Transcript_29320/m.45918 type:complete len:244 (+) Transcript_29320:395-1126(+)